MEEIRKTSLDDMMADMVLREQRKNTYYYLKEENGTVIKQKIYIDKNSLQKLKMEILFSLMKNKENKISGVMENNHPQKVIERYFKLMKIMGGEAMDENDLFCYCMEEAPIIDYDKFEMPRLLQIIDMLLNDKNLIEGSTLLNDYKTEAELIEIEKQKLEAETEEIFQKMVNAHNSGNEAEYVEYINMLSEKKNKLSILSETGKIDEETNEQEKNYMEKIKSCISIKDVQTLDYNTLIEVFSFLEVNLEDIELVFDPAFSNKLNANASEDIKEKIKTI